MRCKPGQDFLPYDRPIAVSKSGSTSGTADFIVLFDHKVRDAGML